MKRIILLCLLSLALLPTISLAAVIHPANIKYIDGDVMFRTPEDDEWLPASINTPLDEGDIIWCSEDSRAEIQLANGTILRLDSNSQMDVIANEEEFTHLHLARGRLYLKTSQSLPRDSLQIDADDTTVLPSARTRLRIDMLPYNQEDVTIFKGSAYVEGNGSRTKVRAGEHIALEDGFNELLPLNDPDEWERWNTARDRQLSRAARHEAYLPDELNGYAADLDSNGTWVRVPEYGMVWRPTVILSSDWAPYRTGRWIWKNGDYIWISYESWGWVPYHYGRWTVVSGFGWCWVPPSRGDVYWGPGYVGWYSTGGYVGWTPLAPGETYYGRRYYGRHSAVVTSVTVNPATIEYRNKRHSGGLTVVQHTDFQRGRIVVQPPSRTPSVSISVSIGAPPVRPLPESRMPVVKHTPPRVAPPRIERFDRRELRERFPRVSAEPGRGERRHQQNQPSTAPAPSLPQQPAVKEKRTVFPVVEPADRTRPSTVQQPADNRKRDEGHQKGGVTSQQPSTAAPQPQQRNESGRRDEQRLRQTPQPPVPSPLPAVTPPRQEQPRRETVQPVPVQQPTPQPSSQGERSRRDEQRQRPQVQPAPQAPPPVSPQSRPAEQKKSQPQQESVRQRGERATDEVREKKIWRVTTPEGTPERDNRENRDRGRRER